MHKLLVPFLLFTLLFYSCTDNSPRYKIGISLGLDDQWSNYSVREILREAALYPDMEVEIKKTHANSQIQSADIKYFVDKNVDVLIVLANDDVGMEDAIADAYDKGIPVILSDGKIKSDKYTTYVSANNYEIGYNAGKYACQLLNGKGKIVEIYAWAKISGEIDRHEGFVKALSEYPNVHLIAELSAEYNMDAKAKQIEYLVRNDIDVDLIFAMNDETALAVSDYYATKNIQRPLIIGVDAIPEAGSGIDAILDNKIDATFIYPTGGDRLIELANKILKGESVDKKINLNSSVVNKSNVWVLQMQNQLIREQQYKVDKINSLLSSATVQYTNQKTILYSIILISVLITILLFVSITAYVNMRKLNNVLRKQKEQVEDLSEQLESATNAKLTFFTNISHEFKTPLTLISGPIQNLLQSDNLSKDQLQLLNIANKNINRLESLIVQIIQFRSYEEGSVKPNFEKNDIRAFLAELNLSFQDYAKRKQINLQFVSEDAEILMWFDRKYLEKMYFNILSNSFRYAKRNINVKLSLKNIEKETFVEILISNDGQDIPADKIDQLFSYFAKLDSNDRRTGIGLAFTKSLVDAHNGTIAMYSKPEEGVTVCIHLPLYQEDVVQAEAINYVEGYTQNALELEMQDSSVSFEAFTEGNINQDAPILLIIEDNADIRYLIRSLFKGRYKIMEAEDGEIGVKTAGRIIPDLIICDIMMPHKDGFDVTKLLKSSIATSHIPIVILTACTEDEQKMIGLEYGADAYIQKPFKNDLLEIRVRKLIEGRSRLKEFYSNSINTISDEKSLKNVEVQFLEKFEKFVIDNISKSELDMADVTQYLGLSRAQLYRKIKSLTNYSPTDMIRIIRLKYAASIMLKGIAVTEAAYLSGFSSPSYFTKSFKDFFNINPSEYIKSNKL